MGSVTRGSASCAKKTRRAVPFFRARVTCLAPVTFLRGFQIGQHTGATPLLAGTGPVPSAGSFLKTLQKTDHRNLGF